MKHLTFKTSNPNRFFKSIIFVATLLLTSSIFSQTVTIDDTKTAEELANQLIDNSCINLSNVGISSSKSVATFNNNGGDFPISEGIIIRTGNAKDTEGPFTNTKLSSEITVKGDSNLQAISNAEGGTSDITDVGSLEFNFTPVGKKFSFKYIFASNEYGEFQCEGRDLFAIILTNIETGESFNLTTLPDNTNVSVKNIRNTSNNILCSSNNEALFDTYYATPTTSSNINMRGFSKVLTASTDVIPNNEYKIKFVIGDYGNSDFDSAVFIEAGSFNNTLDLRKDKELCNGENITVDSGFLKTDNFNFVWTKDNTPLTSETETKIIIDSPGTYGLTITSLTDATCLLRDNIEITTINATQPDDVEICSNDTIINIPNEVEGQILDSVDPSNYSISYFTTESDANSNVNPIPNPTNYQTTVNMFTLWARVSINSTNCFDIVNFDVSINPLPLVDNLPDAYVCLEYILPTLTNGEYYTQSKGEGTRLDVGTPIIVNNTTIYIFNNNTNDCSEESFFKVYIANDFDIDLEYCESFTIPSTPLGKFYKNENGVDEIIPGTDLTADTTVYFYSELNGEVCSEKKFELIITPLPLIDTLPDIVTCALVTLDPLTNGRYFTGNRGTGTEFFAGDIITSSKNLYIYNKDEESGCEKQSDEFFKITIINPDDFIDVTSCDNYILPNKSVGEYYTDSTRSIIIPSGTVITASQTVYYYADEVTTSTNCTELRVLNYN
ncbi:choice-of-anchor L domain-containing protein [Polaribacter sejongensis]|uniref:choice-of-anchor L domain-containing protein n=1 Tax=Polaribacter sejongensis TaxID=985043 RepID=UPI0035A6C647